MFFRKLIVKGLLVGAQSLLNMGSLKKESVESEESALALFCLEGSSANLSLVTRAEAAALRSLFLAWTARFLALAVSLCS